MQSKVRFYEKPVLEKPYLVAAWPGIGNIGLIAINYLKNSLEAKEFAELEPWHFFFPKSISIKDGVFEDIEFPTTKFYYRKGEQDLLILLGEMQPSEEEEIYEIANSVLDVAEEFGCVRIYTAGAAVAFIHHTLKPKVWGVPNTKELIGEIKGYRNTFLMSEIGERHGRGNITGLNGVLLGVAKRRNIDSICLLGEVPVYLANFPGAYTVLYPKASRSILEALVPNLKLQIDMRKLDAFTSNVEKEIEALYWSCPPAIREELDKLKYVTFQPAEPGPITEEEKEKIIKEVEEFFRKGGKHD